jgi:hypothetical protein
MRSFELTTQRNLSRECGGPLARKARGFFVEMWMPNKNGDQSPAEDDPFTEPKPSIRGVFQDVYRFILQAANGERATAETIFKDYLDGKLSEQLLSISRSRVSADQAGSSNRNIEEGSVENKQGGAGGKG